MGRTQQLKLISDRSKTSRSRLHLVRTRERNFIAEGRIIIEQKMSAISECLAIGISGVARGGALGLEPPPLPVDDASKN